MGMTLRTSSSSEGGWIGAKLEITDMGENLEK
jgi:hypothetical protein